MKKAILFATGLIIYSFLLVPIFSQAQNGSLDLSFGVGGKVITDIGSNDVGRSVAIQSDGKLLVAGTTNVGPNTDFALMRYNANGTLDNSFGNGGTSITDIDSNDFASSLAVQTDGKIVMVGSSNFKDFTLVRYLSNGALDNTFGIGGKVTSDIPGINGFSKAVVIQSDGKIILAGGIDNGSNSDIVLLRYKTNGTLDSTFANSGVQITDNVGTHENATSAALQSDGKIVIGAYSFLVGGNGHMMVLRYNTNGTLDNTFGNGGMVSTVVGVSESLNSVAIQSDGKIVIGGSVVVNVPLNGSKDLMLVRYQPNGTLDNTFGNGGIVVTPTDSIDRGYSLALQADGRIILGGYVETANSNDFTLACYNTDGTLYNTFGIAGIVQTDIIGNDLGFSLAIQNDGKIVMVGNGYNGVGNDFIMARYIYEYPDGTSKITNQTQGLRCYPNPFSTQTTLQTGTALHDATLFVYNIFGEPVKKLIHLSGSEIILFREDLPSGIYVALLEDENTTMAKNTIIIENK